MGKKAIFIIIFLILPCGFAKAGQEIVVVQSLSIKPYAEAFNGIKEACPARVHHLHAPERNPDKLIEQIKKIKPAVILTIGPMALKTIMAIKDTPVVYLMVLNPDAIVGSEVNISGVSMNVPADRHLNALMDTLPATQKVGVVYGPDISGDSVALARRHAENLGIELITSKVYASKDVPSALMSMKGKIDVFWMLPDITVVTSETVEFMLLFSFENSLPILTFSEKYVEMGAFMSMNIEADDMGRQAGEMANRILSGEKIDAIGKAYARKAMVSTNMLTARKFGIQPLMAQQNESIRNKKIVKISQFLN